MKKLQNTMILLRCLLYLPLRGRALKRTIPPKRVLIYMATRNLGDAVCMTPIFRELKRRYPQCTLFVLGGKKIGEVLAGNPHIDQYIIAPDETNAVIRIIRNLHAEFGIATNSNALALGALFLAGVPGIAAFSSVVRSSTFPRAYRMLMRLVIQIPFLTRGYIPRNYLKLLKPLGIRSEDLRFELHYSADAGHARDVFFTEHGIREGDFLAAIAPGGSTDIRWWPQERYAAIADYFYERYGATILLMGAGGDRRPIDEVIRHLKPGTPYLNLLNQSLDDFKAFMGRIGLILGNDSGPMVTAEAFDVPSITFVGPTDEREYHPLSEGRHRTVVAPDRGVPVTHALNWNDYDAAEAYRQIRAISVEQAKEELDSLLAYLFKK